MSGNFGGFFQKHSGLGNFLGGGLAAGRAQAWEQSSIDVMLAHHRKTGRGPTSEKHHSAWASVMPPTLFSLHILKS